MTGSQGIARSCRTDLNTLPHPVRAPSSREHRFRILSDIRERPGKFRGCALTRSRGNLSRRRDRLAGDFHFLSTMQENNGSRWNICGYYPRAVEAVSHGETRQLKGEKLIAPFARPPIHSEFTDPDQHDDHSHFGFISLERIHNAKTQTENSSEPMLHISVRY